MYPIPYSYEGKQVRRLHVPLGIVESSFFQHFYFISYLIDFIDQREQNHLSYVTSEQSPFFYFEVFESYVSQLLKKKLACPILFSCTTLFNAVAVAELSNYFSSESLAVSTPQTQTQVFGLNFKQEVDSHLLQHAHFVHCLLACMTCLYEAGGTTAENILYEDISVVIDGG